MSVPVLLPYQQRWIQDRSQVKIAEKSRRIGLTWAEAADCVLRAATRKRDRGEDCFYVGYNKELALEFIMTCAEWARSFSLVFKQSVAVMDEDGIERVIAAGDEMVIRDDRSILVFRIHFDSGFRIVALSSKPSNLRGKQGHVVVDEAAFHSNVPELLKAAMALTIWGGSLAIISTHNGVDNDFNKLCEDAKLGVKPFSVHRITFDDAVGEGLFKRICLVQRKKWTKAGQDEFSASIRAMYGEGAEEELDVVPARSGGQFISRPLVESCMTLAPHEGAVLRFTLEDGSGDAWIDQCKAKAQHWLNHEVMPHVKKLRVHQDHFFGVDFGRVANLTVLAIGELEQSLKRLVPIIIELENCPFVVQELVLMTTIEALSKRRGGKLDNGGLGREMSEKICNRFGQTVEAVNFTEAWYSENMPPMKALFEDGAVALPKDADVLNDLTAIQRIKGVPKLPKQTTKSTQKQKRHGDAAIALALLFAAFGPRRPKRVLGNVPSLGGERGGFL